MASSHAETEQYIRLSSHRMRLEVSGKHLVVNLKWATLHLVKLVR